MITDKNFKKVTPREVAVITGIAISFIWLLLTAFILYGPVEFGLLGLIGVGILYALIAYAIFYFILQNYIYRKIKLIYKIIHSSKVSLKADPVDLNLDNNILDQVKDDVQSWADDRKSEIENLKSLEKYRKDFLGNVSHELKTPLFSVQGYLHTLSDGAIEDENIRHKYIQRALTNVDRLATIVDDLDMITRLENDQLELKLESFNILKLVYEVIEDIEVQAEEKAITLSIKEGADTAFTVVADREAVRQVLVNLLVNSIKYGKQEGRTRIGFYDMDKYILVEIADNGVGIDPDHHKHLFDRFYRVESSGNRATGGSGLGLSIVKHIIESHNQTITVRSSPGEGSTFGFTLEKKG